MHARASRAIRDIEAMLLTQQNICLNAQLRRPYCRYLVDVDREGNWDHCRTCICMQIKRSGRLPESLTFKRLKNTHDFGKPKSLAIFEQYISRNSER